MSHSVWGIPDSLRRTGTNLTLSNYQNHNMLQLEKLKENTKTQNPKDNQILPGDLVMKMSRSLNYSGRNQKLRPKMTNIFLVLMSTQTSAYIRQYSSQNKLEEIKRFRDFIERPRNRSRKVLSSFHVQKCEIS